MFDFLAKGGMLVIPILLCSVLVLAIFLERLIRFTRRRSRGAGLAEKAVALLGQGKPEEAKRIATESNSPMGYVLAKALAVKDQDRETLETVIVHATEEQTRNLSSYLQALPTMVAHSYLIARVEKYEARLQDGAVTFMTAIMRR